MKGKTLKIIRDLEMWKKVTIVLIAIIVFLRILYIGIRGEVDREYINYDGYDLSEATSVECVDLCQEFKGNGSQLNSLELIFDNIADDKKGSIILCIFVDEELLYKTNLSLANIYNREWIKIYVNARIYDSKTYKLTISSSEECTQVPTILVVKENAAPEIVSSRCEDDVINGQFAINYGYLRFPTVADRAVMISLWIVFFILFVVVIIRLHLITEKYNAARNALFNSVNEQTAVAVIEMLLCIVIIGSSGIDFQEPTKVVLYIISLIATIKNKEKRDYVNFLVDTTWKKGILIFTCLYAAFALVGQRIFIYPLTSKVTTAGGAVFMAAILWFIPIIRSLLYYSNSLGDIIFSKTAAKRNPTFILCIVVILIIPAAYNLFANNPGISSPDTLTSMITNAQHLHGMYDWHPFFYCLMLRVILEIWNSTYMVILVQYFFYAYVVTELLMYLRKKEIKDSFLLFVAVFTGFNAANYLHINTIWKDIPYTLSLLWIFVIVAKLVIDSNYYKRKWYVYLELIIAMVGTELYRKNGVVTFVVVTIGLIPFMRKNKKILGSILVSIGIIVLVNGPIYSYFEVESPGRSGMYIGLGQDVLGAYYSGGEVSESTLKMISEMTDYNNAEYDYKPTWSSQAYDVDVSLVDFIKNYISTFFYNPIFMTRAIIDREDALWDIYKGEGSVLGCVNRQSTMDSNDTWTSYYPTRKYVSLVTLASAVSGYTASTQWISAVEWRSGLFTLLGVIAILNLLLKGVSKGLVTLVSPMIGHVMSLLLSTGWSEFRYFWPMNLLNMSFVLVMFVVARNGCGVTDKEIVDK